MCIKILCCQIDGQYKHIQHALKLVNVDLGCYNVMKYIPFLVPEVVNFQCNCNYICFQRHRAPFLYTFLLLFVEMLLLPLFLYILRRPSHMWNEHMYNMTVSDVMEAHAKVLNWMGTLLSNHVARANYNERFSPQGSLSVTKPFWDWLRRVRSKCLTAKSPKLIPIVVSMQP